jgi:hypothetical protein
MNNTNKITDLAAKGFGTPFTIPIRRFPASMPQHGTSGLVPVVLKNRGLFFSAGEVSPADYAMLEQTIHAPMTLHRSTPLRVRIVNRAIDNGPHRKLVPFETLGNVSGNETADWNPVSYPVRGFDVSGDSIGRNVIRKTARLERESSRSPITKP